MWKWFSRRSSNPAVQFAKDVEEARQATQAELRRQLTVSTEQLDQIAMHLVAEMDRGARAPGMTLAMLPSYVTGRVTGREVGTYYALDLGGTNLRVCEVKLNGDGTPSLQHQRFVIPQSAMTGHADNLFDFIAESTGEFLRKRGTVAGATEEAVLGFTFSFPFVANSIDSGILTHWTKGFCTKGVEGMDVVQLLQAAFVRHNLKAKVVCIINDTVGTLVAHAYAHPKTEMGVIM
ncbi:MAG: hexokinase PII, partial [Olpidium bornovanus]